MDKQASENKIPGGFEVDYAFYLRRHDVVYQSSADKPFEGLPIIYIMAVASGSTF